MTKKLISAPLPTLKRLPRYLHILQDLKAKGIKQVSATIIAEELGIDSIQVRKDLSTTGIIGKPKIGFELNELIDHIVHFLNWDNMTDAFLVGLGGLGKAILGYDNFKNYGLNIVAAFDTDPELLDTKVHCVGVFDIKKLEDLAQRMKIHIGVLTVPVSAAQEVAEKMVAGGIKAIWNFAPVKLKLPDNIIIENVFLSQSLGVLTHRLAQLKNTEA